MIQTARRPVLGRHEERTGDPMGDFPPAHYQGFCPEASWAPAINLYQLRQRLDVCVDLAGVEPGSIQVQVETGQLTIQGMRRAPQPTAGSKQVLCIVAMEIDHGPFCRTVPLAQQVDHTNVQIQYTKGLLWIRLALSQVV